jgi:hypothetical protein
MTKILNGVRMAVRWLRSLDVRLLLVVTLIVVSTGHVGRLFADREANGQAFVGYVLALSIDGVLAVSLYEAANVRKRSHRVFALCVFVFACAVSGAFNTAYYREHYPGDPAWVSVILGVAAPVLAALVSVLKSFGDVERTENERNERESEREAERVLELEKLRIEQEERTRREQLIAKERTAQERAKARAEKARANAIVQVSEQGSERQTEQGISGNGRLKPGELDDLARLVVAEKPGIGARPLARRLGCSPSTAYGILKRLQQEDDDD